MATIKDIARMADVSMMTVSRAFNNPEQVKEALRLEIYRIAEEIHYRPNQAARSLATSRTGVIQIITSMNAYEYYFTQLFAGVADHLSEKGYSIMISRDYQLNYRCDGLILMGLGLGEDKRILKHIKTPTVLIGKTDMEVDWIDVDNVDGIFQVTEYLINNGHKNISYLDIDSTEGFGGERYDGYKKCLHHYNIKEDLRFYFQAQNDLTDVRDKAKEILLQMVKFESTAIICATDVMAFGLINIAKQLGIKIPKDISVVGFDGFLFHMMTDPHLTTVSQPIYKMGADIADVLIERLEKPEMPLVRRLIKTDLIIGESVKSLL